MLVGCLFFAVCGLGMMILGEDTLSFVVGLGIAAFFGLGVIAFFVRIVARNSFMLDEHGVHPGGGGFVPWKDIGAIGPTLAGGTPALGLEILDVPAYLDTLTEKQKRQTLGFAGIGRLVGSAAGSPELDSMPNGDLLGLMAWAKEVNGGYDMAFAAVTLSTSVEKMAVIVEDYRQQATQAPEGGPTASPTE